MRSVIVRIYQFIMSLEDYLVREWLMNCPSHLLRKIIIKSKFKSVGTKTNFLLGLEFRNIKNIAIGDNSVVNKKMLLDG